MRTLSLVVIGLFLGAPAAADLRWYWAFDGEAGTFLTDGALSNSAAAPGSYELIDFFLDESQLGFAGSLSGGDFRVWQPEQEFVWDGAAPTQFFRSNGKYTNGAAIFVETGDESYAFNPGTSRVYDTQAFEEFALGALTMGPVVGCGDGYVDAPSEARIEGVPENSATR